MITTSKIAITLPNPLYQSVEKICKTTGASRSAVIATALRHWLASHGQSAKEQKYIEGYRARPEVSLEFDQVALQLFANSEPWE